MLLTEDKKAIKKSSQPKNKVRFQLDNEHAVAFSSSSPTSTSSLKSSSALTMSNSSQKSQKQQQKYQHNNYENENELKLGLGLNSGRLANESNVIKAISHMTRPISPIESQSLLLKTPMQNQHSYTPQTLMSSSTPSMTISNSTNNTTTNNGFSILKVYLENRAIKSFKYDRNTCVKDVLWCLKEKLAINNIEYFGLVLKPSNNNSISKFKLLHELQHLYEINEMYLRADGGGGSSCCDSSSSPSSSSDETGDMMGGGDEMDEGGEEDENLSGGLSSATANGDEMFGRQDLAGKSSNGHVVRTSRQRISKKRKVKPVNYICLFRFVFVPSDFHQLKANDENAFNYLYEQVRR